MNKVRIFLSTALVDNSNKPISHNDQRNDLSLDKRIDEYLECFNIIKDFGYDFTIVETVATESKFLEEHANVFYTNVNENSYKNRGSNYANAFKKLMNICSFEDDDLIVHITGRYPLINDSFLKKCISLEGDVIGCFSKDIHDQCYLFLYAMRYKELKFILNSIDINYLEYSGDNLERVFSEKIKNYKINLVEKLGIIGRQSSSPDATYNKEIY